MELIHITRESGIPLMGCIAFGIIDRGTDLLQVRPTTVCNMHCKFCSVSANNPDMHPASFTVDKDYLLEELKKVIEFKGVECEVNLDSVGEITTYSSLVELVKGIKAIPKVKRISMQTNGTLLTGESVYALEKAGINQINLSINSLDSKQAADLSGCNTYSLDHILQIAKMISDSSIQLLIAPVWIPKVNDAEIPKLIELAKQLNAKIGIQKYETYRYSRKIKGTKPITFWKFYQQLKQMEKETGMKLVLGKEDFNIHKANRIPPVFEERGKIQAVVKCPGWNKGQVIAVAKGVCISVNKCSTPIGKTARVKILETKNNIYVAEMARG